MLRTVIGSPGDRTRVLALGAWGLGPGACRIGRRRPADTVKELAGAVDDERAGVCVPRRGIDGRRIEVSEIDAVARLARDARGERDPDARPLEAAACVE